MKIFPFNKLPLFLLIILTVSGCATTNPTQSEQTLASIEAVQEQLNKISEQLERTRTSLEDVTNANTSELEEAYDSFDNNVENLVEMKNEFSNLSEEMRSNSNKYLAEWQQEGETYDSGQLRSASEDRREVLNKTFEEVMNNSGEVSRSLEKYISHVKEINSYLANDLTTEGAEGIDTLSQKVEMTGDDVRNVINRMQQSIAQAKREMGSD